jgi:hypothetical protein
VKPFEIGQSVYTSKQINGWFDYALEHSIPKNTLCKIKKIISLENDINSIIYEVEFQNQFAAFHLRHNCLKLGEI